MNKKYRRILIALLFVFGSIILFANINSNEQVEFKKSGVEVIATISDIISKEEQNISGMNEVQHFVEVSFFTKEKSNGVNDNNSAGEYIKTKIPVGASKLYKFRKGYKMKVLYLKEDPYKVVIKDDIK